MQNPVNLPNYTANAILRRPQVEALTGLSRSSIYRMMDADKFPKPRRIGAQAVGWIAQEIDTWIASRSQDHF